MEDDAIAWGKGGKTKGKKGGRGERTYLGGGQLERPQEVGGLLEVRALSDEEGGREGGREGRVVRVCRQGRSEEEKREKKRRGKEEGRKGGREGGREGGRTTV